MPELEVKWLLPDGTCGGMGPDGPVSLGGALPGDLVRFEETGRRGRTVFGTVVERIKDGPDRVPSTCQWSSTCGGCDLDQLGYSAQLHALANVAQRALRHPDPPPMEPSPRRSQHRARIKLALQGHQVGYRQAKSHTLVVPELCAISRPEVQHAHGALRKWVTQHGSDGLSEVELRSDGARVVYAFTSDGQVPRAIRDVLSELGDVALDGRRLHGDPTLTLLVEGLSLRASPRTFFQVNLEANLRIVRHVLNKVAEVRPERIVDLYAGIGNFSLPLAAETGVHVLAVEREGQAMVDLRHSAEAAGLGALITEMTVPVERWDASTAPFDVVVLDPPRVGAEGVIPGLIRNRPRRIVYVSCHVPAAARDLRSAMQAGYTIQDVTCFDLFPDTHHFETVITLDRGPARSAPKKKPQRRHKRRR